jgi:organic radical activating enzyme
MTKKIVEFGDDTINLTTFLWNLIDVCNYKCSYCNAPHGRNYSDFKEYSKIKRDCWKNVVKRLSVNAVGRYEMQIFGGEPSLHPDYETILKSIAGDTKCESIEIFTNLSRSVDFYGSACNDSKITYIPAYHTEHYTDSFIKKIVILSSSKYDFNIEPVINLSPHKKDWPVIMHIIDTCKNNNIRFRLNFLHSEPKVNYVSNYTDEFWEQFDSILRDEWSSLTRVPGSGQVSKPVTINKDPAKTRDLFSKGTPIDVVYDDGTSDEIDENVVIADKLNKFEGWSCRAMMYYIDLDGSIRNYCTGKELPVYITSKELTCYKTCPHGSCDRRAFVYNNKLRYHRKK